MPEDEVTCHILVTGKPNRGQTLYGPFESEDEATLWAAENLGSQIFQILPVYGKVQP